jgi:hypothetical protein
MKINTRVIGAFMLGLIGPVAIPFLSHAGDMEPPGSPASTMKTLEQVEPRTPIHNSDLPMTITSSGSYYLAEDIPAANGGITVNASNVTIDLMGFSFCGGGASAVYVDASAKNVTVKNGTVCNWTACAIRLEFSEDGMVLNVQAHNNHAGICVGPYSVVSECLVSESDYQGYVLEHGSVITASTASDNGDDGIRCAPIGGGGSCTITGCSAYGNGANGILTSLGSTIENCVAIGNSGDGISAGIGSTVRGNSSRFNEGDGIEVHTSSIVLNNTSVDNGQVTADGAGIHATGAWNRIDGNHCQGNSRGIDVDAVGNIIVRNSVGSNTVNFDIVAGNNWTSNTPDAAGPWDNLDL